MSQPLGQTQPIATIITPLYNAELFIGKTLKSLLAETKVPIEIIVVNDQSTDRSAEIVQSFKDPRLRLIHNPKKGLVSALNLALSKAQGEITMRCDADDLFTPDRISDQVRWLQTHPEFGAVCGRYDMIDAREKIVSELLLDESDCEITQELRRGYTRTHLGTYAIRTEILRSLQGFRLYFQGIEDIDLQLRLSEVCRVWFTNRNCYKYRLHNHSITHTGATVRREFLDHTARIFQKQRAEIGQDDLQRGCPPEIPSNTGTAQTAAEHIHNQLLGYAWRLHARGKWRSALMTGLRAVFLRPRKLKAWRSLIALIFKPAGAGPN